MSWSLAATAALTLPLTPRLPLPGVAVRRRLVVARTLLREVSDAETVRQNGSVEAGLVAATVATGLAQPRVVVAATAAQIGKLPPAITPEETAHGLRQAQVAPPARGRPLRATRTDRELIEGGDPLFPHQGHTLTKG